MEVSIGFIILVVFILLPGLLFRRLYFFGEFSKQFYSCYGLPRLLAVSVIPGVVICGSSCYAFHHIFMPIDIGTLVNGYKHLIDPNFQIPLQNDGTLSIFNGSVFYPMCKLAMFEILIALIFVVIAVFTVHALGLDKRFKLLRFENYWFYAFSAQCEKFKKFKAFRTTNKRHVMTKADILVNNNSGTTLYSGIVVDYELKEQEASTLSKVYLHEAKRYKVINGKSRQVDIPGQILIVDCHGMSNINLTYIYQQPRAFLESNWPAEIEVFFSLIYMLLIPCFIFTFSWLKEAWYIEFVNFGWVQKIVSYFLVIQVISFLNPIIRKEDGYVWFFKDWWLFLGKIIAFVIFGIWFWLLL